MSDTPVWFVTGASRGMGLDIVKAALAEGYRVVATSRKPENLSKEITAGDDQFLAVALHFDQPDGAQAAVDAAVAKFGTIDVVVNNAGYIMLGGVEELSDEEVRANFDVNVFGVLAVMRSVLPVMRKAGSGTIFSTSSISANATGPATGLYSATKAAVLMFSEALAAEAAPLGIRAVAIAPGGVRTDFLGSSARRVANRIDAYTSVAMAEQGYDQLNHNQGGDPARVAQVLIALASAEHVPRVIYLGGDALNAIVRVSERTIQQAQQYQQISLSIDD